jgi:hypothetical protein
MNIISAVSMTVLLIIPTLTGAILDERTYRNSSLVSEQILKRSPNDNRVQLIERVIDESGVTLFKTNTITQLEDGLNYWSEEAQTYVASEELIELDNDGNAIARRGQQKLILSGNANDPNGVVDLTGPDGRRIRASALALKYYDPVTGEDATLAILRDTPGELIPPNQVIYRDAFEAADPKTTVHADILYTYKKSGLEQDVILREPLPSPEYFNLGNEVAQLQVLTEFFNPPQPDIDRRIEPIVYDPNLRARVAAPDWVDEELIFGSFRIGQGKAFALRDLHDHKAEPAAAVAKQWLQEEKRAILFESIDYLQVAELFEKMKVQANINTLRRAGNERAFAARALNRRSDTFLAKKAPQRQVAEQGRHSIALAEKGVMSDGIVLDYTTISTGQSSYTFRAGETYNITGDISLSGQTTIEGEAILKISPGKKISIQGTIVCNTGMYRSAIITSRNDNKVGQTVPLSTGIPAPGDYSIGIELASTGTHLIENLRILYADTAVKYAGAAGGTATIRHSQIVKCNVCFASSATATCNLRNVLGYDFGTFLSASAGIFTINGQHVTANHGTGSFASSVSVGSFENSVFTDIPTLNFSNLGSHSVAQTSTTGIYDPLGNGFHYLLTGRRDSGTSASIDQSLLADLKLRTTVAPILLTANFTQNTTFIPRGILDDNSLPDIGYHYDPLDFCWSGLQIAINVTLTLKDGVAVGFYGSKGLLFTQGAQFVSEGLPNRLNRFVRYDTVQEQPLVWGGTFSGLFDLGSTVITAPYPQVRLNFTDLAFVARSPFVNVLFLNGSTTPLGALTIANSQVRGAYFLLGDSASPGHTVTLNNSSFDYCTTEWQFNATYSPPSITAFNNLFNKGSLSLTLGYYVNWTLKDNLFNSDTLTKSGTGGFNITPDYNGYKSGLVSLGGTHNKTGLTAQFIPGPLGMYYYASSWTTLLDAGSRTYSVAGLYHYTVKSPANTKESTDASPTVDIGCHYPAVDSTNLPLDNNSDGIPDCIQDKNGNGLVEVDETPWLLQVAKPVISRASGTFSDPISVVVYCITAGAELHYTLDGLDPTTSSPLIQSGQKISIFSTKTLKCAGFKTGWQPSAVVSATYTLALPPPVFNRSSGAYTAGTVVSIYDPIENAVIRYRTDGTDPIVTDPPASQITLTSTTKVIAKAWANGTESAAAVANYTVMPAPSNDDASTPTLISGARGSVFGTTATAVPNSSEPPFSPYVISIWYKWTAPQNMTVVFDLTGSKSLSRMEVYQDQQNWTSSSPVASAAAFSVGSASCSFTATANTAYRIGVLSSTPGPIKLNWFSSDFPAPAVYPESGTFTAAFPARLSTDIPGAEIHYTIDGTQPTRFSPVFDPDAGLIIEQSGTLKAIAFKPSSTSQTTTSAAYTIASGGSASPIVLKPQLAASGVTFSASVPVTVTCGTSGATIRYTLNGMDPTTSDQIVASGGTVTISQSSELKVKAWKTGSLSSEMATQIYAKLGSDTDFDLIPDAWEVVNYAKTFTPDADEPSEHPLAHGISNFQLYSNPSVGNGENISSANDGIPDWWKVLAGVSLTDATVGQRYGRNGMTLQQSYSAEVNPTEAASRPDSIPAPDFSISHGPNNALVLILNRIDTRITTYRLAFFGQFWDIPAPANGGRFLICPTTLPEAWFEFTLQGITATGVQGEITPYSNFDFYKRPIAGTAAMERYLIGDAKSLTWADPERPWGLVYETPWPWPPGCGGWTPDLNYQIPTYTAVDRPVPGDPFAPPQPVRLYYYYNFFDEGVFEYDSGLLADCNAGLSYNGITSSLGFFPNSDGLFCNSELNPAGLKVTEVNLHLIEDNADLFLGVNQSASVTPPYGSFYEFQATETPTTKIIGYSYVPQTIEPCFWDGSGLTDNPFYCTSVGSSLRIAAFAKRELYRPPPNNMSPLPQNGYTTAYLFKSFLCDSATGDVPRTTEPNLGGKFKINLTLAQESGLISPLGYFIPEKAGKYVLMTEPNDEGKYGECIVYVLDMQVDSNHDGVMNNADLTSITKPMVFWLNNDTDVYHSVDGTDTEYDDVQSDSVYARDAVFAAVWGNLRSERDLEDYARLWINGLSQLRNNLPTGFKIRLEWDTSHSGGSLPGIQLFKAVEQNGGTNYLNDQAIATTQMNGQLVGGIQGFRYKDLETLATSDFFIFSGISRGTGFLRVQVLAPTGDIQAQAGCWLQLKDIKELYERWTVGENPASQAPETTEAIALDVPRPLHAFRYEENPGLSTVGQYILFVHGWNMETWEKDRFAETALKRLYWQGYQGRVGAFRWPTDNGFGDIWDVLIDRRNYDNSELNAWRSAPGLKSLLSSKLWAKYPQNVYMFAHSMGNVVAGEALRLSSIRICQIYVAAQAAVPAHTYDPTKPAISFDYLASNYGPATPNIYNNWFSGNSSGVFKRKNFYNANDWALNRDHWELNQLLKPDQATALGWSYRFDGSPYDNLQDYNPSLDDASPNHFLKISPTTTINFDINVADQRYEVMAYAAETRSSALGHEPVLLNGSLNLASASNNPRVWATDLQSYSAHKWHSAQFRSTNMRQKSFWNYVLNSRGFELKQ